MGSNNRKLTTSEFILKLSTIQPDLVVLSEYINARTSILVKNNFGICSVTPFSLLRGSVPTIRTAVNKQEYFKQQLRYVHGDFYDYSNVVYIDGETKIHIVCGNHGGFTQSANHHIQGHGCPRCTQGFWTKAKWVSLCERKNLTSRLYVIRCYNESEEFIKIGITSQSVYDRFSRHNTMPYKYDILEEVIGDPADIYDMETKLHTENIKHHYIPRIHFVGSVRECFTVDAVNKKTKSNAV